MLIESIASGGALLKRACKIRMLNSMQVYALVMIIN